MNHNYWQLLRNSLAVLFVIFTYYLFKWIIGNVSLYPYLNLPVYLLEEGSWVYAVEHHTIQLVLALVVIGLLSRGNFREWGLNTKNLQDSFQLLKTFCYYYIVYFIGISFILQFINYPGPPFNHSYTASQIIGYLGFGFILTGLSEEILFRGFMHTFLAKYFSGIWHWKNIDMPVAGVITAVIFTVAHIGFTLYPFEVWHLNPLQLIQAFVLGLFYSWAYHKTGSLLTPILAHNISNGSMWSIDYLLYFLKIGC